MTFNGEFEAASAEYGIRALSSGEAKWLEEQTEKRCKEYVDEFGGVRLIDKDGQPVVIKSGDTVRIKVEGELFQGEKELVFWALGDSNRVYRAADIKRVEPTVDGVKQPVYYEFQTKDLSALLFGHGEAGGAGSHEDAGGAGSHREAGGAEDQRAVLQAGRRQEDERDAQR